MTRIRRRTLTLGLAATSLTLGSGVHARTAAFKHGVASGDPGATSVVIWTRVDTSRRQEPVTWQVARDARFRQVVAKGETVADALRDHCVKVIATNLRPGQRYYYQFTALGETSQIGQTRTLPIGATARVGIALASCSNYAFGFFNAYDAIAKDDNVDFVLHTGDYIYEYGARGWGGDVAARIGRLHEPAHEIVTLDDYRMRHAQYKRDAGSIAMHAAHPLIVLWDDHESANNPWMGGAQNHQPEAEGLWRDRRSASLRAYYEWMPIREPAVGQHRQDLWREYVFGDLATLVTLESRHGARARQIDYADHLNDIRTPADARRFEAEVLAQSGRQMLSPQMQDFLAAALTRSVRAGQPWRLLGNAIPLARMPVPDVGAQGIAMPDGNGVPGTTADLVWKGRFNLPFYLDTWDGYPWARERLYDAAIDAGATDLIALTGDSHSFWANRLTTREGRAMGVEIGTAGISSPGDFVETGFDAETASRLDQMFAEQIPDVVWTDNLHRGYVRVALTHDGADVDYRTVSTVETSQYTARTLRSMRLLRKRDTTVFA